MQRNQRPRIEWLPPGGEPHPNGRAALELVEAAGLYLDPWQQYVLDRSLYRKDGRWAAMEVGLCCPRQNGKNALVEARELAGLLILGERLIIHSAHQADTAKEAFRRLELLIEMNDWLYSEVKAVRNQNGHEAIEMKNGCRIRFRTRTKGGGRGFSGACVIFDEAMIFPEASLGAIFPIVSAQPDPQLIYTGSAVDQEIYDDGVVFARLRDRAIRGGDPRLAYFEWSADADHPGQVDEQMASDPDVWAAANPAFGIRIEKDYIEAEHRSVGPRTFAVERLGVGDWPSLTGDVGVIPLEKWLALTDKASEIGDTVVFGFDTSPDRSYSAVSAAGAASDGRIHVEIVDYRRGASWVPGRVAELVEKHRPAMVVYDASGAAGSLTADLARAGVDLTPLTSREHAQACGMLADAVDDGSLSHYGTQELTAAVRSAIQRPLADAWAWSRRGSSSDISPLVAITLALWGAKTAEKKRMPVVLYA